MKIKKIGLRTIKSGISVSICLIIGEIFGLTYPFYASIASVICMQGSVSGSFSSGIHRMVGTFYGAILAIAFLYLGNNLNFALGGIGVLIIIYLCNLSSTPQSSSIGCIVFLAMLTGIDRDAHFVYAMYRLSDTLIGIVVAIVVNYLFYRPEYSKYIRTVMEDITTSLSACYKELVTKGETLDLSPIVKNLNKLNSLIHNQEKEYPKNPNKKIDLNKVKSISKISSDTHAILHTLNILETPKDLSKENADKILSLYDSLDNSEVLISESPNEFYNELLSKGLNNLEILKTNEIE